MSKSKYPTTIDSLKKKIEISGDNPNEITPLNVALLFCEMEDWYKHKCNWEHRCRMGIYEEYIPSPFEEFIKRLKRK